MRWLALVVLSICVPTVAVFGQDETGEESPTVTAAEGFRITSADDAFSLRVSGRLQVDGRFALGEDDPATSTLRVRRIRITTSGRVYTHYKYVVQVDFSNRGASLQDGWLDVAYWEAATFRLGNTKVPFGMEALQSDNWVRLVERSMITNYGPLYEVGVMVFGRLFDGRLGYSAGLFNGNGLNTVDANSDKDFAGRVVIRPFATSQNSWVSGVQLEVAGMLGNQERAAVAGTGARTLVGSPIFNFNTDVTRGGDRTRLGIGAAWHAAQLGVSAEYLQHEEIFSEPTLGEERSSVAGWYLTVAYAITGELQSFGPLKVERPFSPGGGGPGAWEGVIRVGRLVAAADLAPYITGARGATQVIAGVNWHPVNAARISTNYQHAQLDDGGSEDSIVVRVQLVY